MDSKKYLVALTILGWFVFVFASPAIFVGIFLALGTAQPWSLMTPVFIFTAGWLLTRLDFKEIYWKKTLSEILIIWGFSGLFATLLIISRTDSVMLTFVALPVVYCFCIAGLLMRTFFSRRQHAV